MKAIAFTKYGSPEVLQLEEVDKPTPKDDEVLIKVHAASVNDWDWQLLQGKPFVNRLLFGLRNPNIKTLGCDVAGQVEAVGNSVTQFQPGDEVYGDLCEYGWGAYAEYVCVHENALTLKPVSLTFEEAAAVPQAAVLALQGLRENRQLQPGQKVLIIGAGGGVGTFAIQMTKSFGAKVTGVDATEKLELMRSLGADHVIDYTKEDVTKTGQRYDRILDTVAPHSIFDYKRVLNTNGLYFMIGGSMPRILQAGLLGPMLSVIEGKKLGLLAHKPNKDMAFINELFDTGKVKPVIDRCYPLSEVAEALQYFGEGHHKGKVVVAVANARADGEQR